MFAGVRGQATTIDGTMRHSQNNVVQIGDPNAPRCFTLSEAQETLATVKPITANAHNELEAIKSRLHTLLPSDPRIVTVEQEYEAIVRKWISKMNRLGLTVRGLWLLDFDTGDGYFCWKYPELTISHFHPYNGGFVERRPIAEVIRETHPDWADVDDDSDVSNETEESIAVNSLLRSPRPD